MRLKLTSFMVLLLSLAAFAFPPPDEYRHGMALVNFTQGVENLNISMVDGIVHFGIPELDQLTEEFGVYVIENVFPSQERPANPALVDLSRWHRIHFPLEVSVEEVVNAFKGKPYIEIVEPDPLRRYDYVPNDPMVGSQYHISNLQCYDAWNVNRGNYLVDIGVVDSGVDTAHTDLDDGWWINYGEDVNGDSIIDLWDWNGLDDDFNGYIDDFWGWDFIGWDNIPHDASADGHGTHVAGIASADTDNETGVAGIGFDTRVMHLRCGYGGFIQQGYNGITYAGLMYADVVNCSWGGTWSSYIEQQTINYAHQRGTVFTASAGNEAPPAYNHYPSKYNNVIAVGSVNQYDVKVFYSNYCITPFDGNCDVMAPGWEVLSTNFGGGYVAWSGTSMAAPGAAGVCLLIRSMMPELSAAEVETVLVNSCDNIYPQNPGYAWGLLGYGRVNAFAAMNLIAPNLSLSSMEIIDDGNNDGRADPGETCDLIIDILNDPSAQPAENIQGVIACEDAAVTLINTTSTYGDIPPGSSVSNTGNPFEFSVGPTEPHFADFTLTLSGGGFSTVIPFQLELGRPDVLLVDDDEGNFFETFYLTSFDLLGMFVDVWDESEETISGDELLRYEAVFWENGNSLTTLNNDEQTAIQIYLDGGGNFFISSKNAGAEIGATTFYSDYLHASFVADTVSGSLQLSGAAGHPFADNTTLFLIGGTGAGNTQSMDAIEPLPGALTAYTYDNTSYTGGISYEGTHKVVYFGFPLEAVTGLAGTTPRDEAISNILEWFDMGGALTVTLTPVNPPIVIPGSGGTFQFNIAVANSGTSAETFDVWTMATLPNGNEYGPIIGPINLTLASGVSINRDRSQAIPAGAPTGDYTYDAYVGDYPSTVLAEDHFEFTKIAEDNSGPIIPDWYSWGESFVDEQALSSATSPTGFILHQAHPNPFNPATSLTFSLPEAGNISLSIYDIQGREVATLIDGWRNAGMGIAVFDGSQLSSGIYFACLQAGGERLTQKLLLIK